MSIIKYTGKIKNVDVKHLHAETCTHTESFL